MQVLGKSIRVLLVDDDEDDFLIIKNMIRDVGGGQASLTWASSFQEAADALSETAFDICLVDYRLGEKTGFDFMEEASKLGIRTPMIILTGAGDRSIDEAAMKQGAVDFLIKASLTSEILERSIRYSLKSARDLERIREREENFRRLFDSASEGMIVYDLENTVIDANATAARIYGCSQIDLIGKKFPSLVHFADFHEFQEARAAEENFREATTILKNGRKKFLEVCGQEIQYHGQRVHLASVRDVTARREMEQQVRLQDRLASVGLLTSGLAHEIGNPMAVIQMRIGLLARQLAGNGKAEENVKIIGVQLERINKLVRSLLGFARGTGKTMLECVDVNQAVTEVLALMKYEFLERHISVLNEISGEMNAGVKGETGALQQILLNLLINAAHAIEAVERPSDGRENFIRISLAENGEFSELRIEDSGCGISPENRKNLFRPFFSTKEIGKGTGLGLVTCHRIVESWGGSIAVESEFGLGTTFKIALPKALAI
ncbi:MAG: ATP-binding protein [Bdellovibrionota bacterium]